MVILTGCVPSCRQRVNAPNVPSLAPIREIDWTGTGGFLEWGQTGDGFFGISVKDILMTWTWAGETLTRGEDVKLPRVLDVIVLPHGEYLACRAPGVSGEPWPLVWGSCATNEIIREWPVPQNWYYRLIGSSPNRRFAAVLLEAKTSISRRVGIFDIASGDLHYIADYQGMEPCTAGWITVSNDGKHIATAGWGNGISLFDVDAKALKWFKSLKGMGITNLSEVEFSPDGETLYAADTGGESIYAFETLTGEVKHQWHATAAGNARRGPRISCFAVSPDGNWLAAGMGPTAPAGEVFLFDVNNPGSTPTLFRHGSSTILIVSFSSDSKHLASVAGGKIKIWAVNPQENQVMQDANANVIGIVNETGRLVERYEYTPHGERTIYGRLRVLSDVEEAATWANDALLTYPQLTSARICDTIPVSLCEFGWQGLRHDPVSGLIDNRGRMYSPRLARFMQRDPAGYWDINGLGVGGNGPTGVHAKDVVVGGHVYKGYEVNYVLWGALTRLCHDPVRSLYVMKLYKEVGVLTGQVRGAEMQFWWFWAGYFGWPDIGWQPRGHAVINASLNNIHVPRPIWRGKVEVGKVQGVTVGTGTDGMFQIPD